MKKNMFSIKKQMQDEQARLRASKTKEDLNEIFKDKTIIIQDGGDWNNERCQFVEMVGEGERKNWKMKLKTKFGTFLERGANEVMIVTQTIQCSSGEEADRIGKNIKKEFE